MSVRTTPPRAAGAEYECDRCGKVEWCPENSVVETWVRIRDFRSRHYDLCQSCAEHMIDIYIDKQ